MDYLYTIQDAIRAICQKRQKGESIQTRIGMRTNGDLHLGNLFPIIISVIIGKELIAKGYKYKLIVIFVDQEINDDDLPFNFLNYSETKTLAQYSIDIIKNFITELIPKDSNFILEYEAVSRSQKTKPFRKLLVKILNNSNKVIPIYAICKKCGELLKNYKKNGNILVYHCNKCNFDYNLNLDDMDEELMLNHDLLGAIENNLFNIDLHILGSDHEIKKNGCTNMEKRIKYQKIINNTANHLTLLTPLLLFKNNKMSKSSKNGIFLNEIKIFFKNKYLKKLTNFIQKNNTKAEIVINNIRDI